MDGTHLSNQQLQAETDVILSKYSLRARFKMKNHDISPTGHESFYNPEIDTLFEIWADGDVTWMTDDDGDYIITEDRQTSSVKYV